MEKKKLVVYHGGHILNQGLVEYREKQHHQINEIEGIEAYSPHQDKSINDKANAVQAKLAERILFNDFKAMQEADVFVFDVLNEGIGTITEIGIVLGMKHQAEKVIKELQKKHVEMGHSYEEACAKDPLFAEACKTVDKPVLCYCSDIRQGHGKPYTDPDRAEYSTNQFLYGAVLYLTDGEGFISWEEVLKRLKTIGGQINE